MDAIDGGAAFPVLEAFQQYDDNKGCYREVYQPFGGMTLRDYFAGQFLTTVHIDGEGVVGAAIARSCYAIADAMLAERAK